MIDHLFIAEKPSLAKEIAAARGEETNASPKKTDGCWRVGNDAVTWLFGHMYENAPPEHYSEALKQWRVDSLPIIPDKWTLLPLKDKKQHIRSIAGLLKEARVVVNAGDAAREGQLLVDELLLENGWDPFSKATKRLWVRSVARKDLLEALASMVPNAEKRSLYDSAVCRQRADWLLGMNLTRLFTVLARNSGADQLVSVGRVQTPTLNLVVQRDREIAKFKAVDHYLPQVRFRHDNGTFTATWVVPDEYEGLDPEGRLIDRGVAERIAAKVDGKEGKVAAYTAQNKSKAPPLPYSLSALQAECSSKFGLSAQQTLEVAQSLYDEHKVTTYPRSDSRYLPLSILKDEAPEIVRNLGKTTTLGELAQNANLSLRSAAWNDSKVSDHHGIIPTTEATEKRIAALPDLQRKVFLLIARTFIAQFYPDMRYKSLSATVTAEGETFKASGRKSIDIGWKRVFGAEDADDEQEEDDQAVPEMNRGDSVLAEASSVQSKRTTPPARFTDGTLIIAMTQIHRFVTNADVKKRLKENDGLGTEATRANIIETLIRRKYLQRKGKHLISTSVGQSVIDALPADVTDPGLTAIWEGYLDRVYRGELDPDRFMSGQIDTLKKRIEAARGSAVKIEGASKVRPLEGHGETCEACGKGKMITREIRKGEHKGKKFLSCNAWDKDDPNSCKNVRWPDRKPIEPLPGHGSECPNCGKGALVTRMIAKGERKGQRFLACNAWRRDDPDSCSHAVWPDDRTEVKPLEGHGAPCEKCGKGKMVTREIRKGDNKGKKFLACDNWRRDDPDSCTNRVWPDDGNQVQPLDGHGKSCSDCGQGTMVTREIRKGERKGERFLSCSRYPECKHSENPGRSSKTARGKGGLSELRAAAG